MIDSRWLLSVYSNMVESLLETAIVLAVVRIVLRWCSPCSPAVVSRFLLLPLVIPVLLSPLLHLIFPQLTRLELAMQIDRAFPMVEAISRHSVPMAPLLLVVFTLLLGLNLARGLVIALREVRDAARIAVTNDPPVGQAALTGLAARLGVKAPRLIVSARHPTAAYVFGWHRPIILLGQHWLTQLDAEELEAVFAHELAHFKHGDTWQVLVAQVCRDLMFFNPLAHHVYQRLIAAREEAADDRAMQVTRKPLALASCLVKFWQAQQLAPALAGGLALAGQPARLERRIYRLITAGDETRPDRNLDGVFYGLCVALTVLLTVV